MQIKNGVYVPVELDWEAVKARIAAAEETGEEVKYIPAGTAVASDGDLKYMTENNYSLDTTNVIGILPENLWIKPDAPIIKRVNALIAGDLLLDVDMTTLNGPDAFTMFLISVQINNDGLPGIRLFTTDGTDIRKMIGG